MKFVTYKKQIKAVIYRLLLLISLTYVSYMCGFVVGVNDGFDMGKKEQIATEQLRGTCLYHNGKKFD